MKAAIYLSVGLAVCGVITPPASADVTIEMRHNDSPQVLFIAEDALCVEHPEGMMIFHAKKEVLWAVDAANESYHEITKEDLQKMGDQLAAMKTQMEESMKDMPPEQRAMVEKMMSGKLPGGTPAEKEVTIKSLDAKKEINGFKTEGYEVYQEGVLREEVWTASPKALGLKLEDFEIFKKFSDFIGTGIPGMEDLVNSFAKDFNEPDADQVPGFPVLTIGKDAGGKEQDRTELVKAEKGKIDPAKFELPEGLEKQSSGLE